MTTIELVKASTDWMDEPRNIETVSDCHFDGVAGQYRFTGFLGHLCDRERGTGPRYALDLAAVIRNKMLTTGARITVGHGAQQFTVRMPVTHNLFLLCCSLQASGMSDMLDPRIAQVRILHGAANTFIPTL